MSLKNATLIVIIGQALSLFWVLCLNLNLFHWSRIIGLIFNLIGIGSLILFFSILYSKQK